ncbi:MAG: tetratricopeptide repeat protein [Bacteroidetes bacterium]|nr:tetratricopeptide repeat protein [Bacteroidota bacterium]
MVFNVPTVSQKEIEELIQAAYVLRVNNLGKSIEIAEDALHKSLEIRYALGTAQVKNQLSLFYFIRCEFEKSLNYANDALTYFEQTGDKKGIALSKYNMGSTYYRTNNFSKGLNCILQSINLFEELNDFHNLARAYKSTGTIYEFFQDYASAEQVYQKCIEASRKANDTNSESNAYNPLSGLYLKQGKTEMASALIEKSIALKMQSGDRRGLAYAIYGRAKLFAKLQKTDLAEKDFLEALSMHKESGDKLGLCMASNKLGRLYFQMQNFEAARHFSLLALEQALQLQISIIAIKAYYQLYLLEKQEGNQQAAFDYLEKYLHLKESAVSTETLHVIKSYEEKSKIEHLEMEARVQREKREIIENKNAELDSFFYRISHDLKGPIASLMGLHNLVEQEVKDELSLQYFKMHQSQIIRIHNIVMGLISLTQMNHLHHVKVKINFTELIDECIQSYRYLDNFKNIEFIKEIEDQLEYTSEWPIINTILQNLIENAIKYAKSNNPFVKISVGRLNESIRIIIADNGTGIDPAHQSKIFDMFYRANERTKGSSGLGLYILKRAVERLNGRIELKSKLNEGSTFTVILPY